jgi:uroporphyrinogen decarboxylase
LPVSNPNIRPEDLPAAAGPTVRKPLLAALMRCPSVRPPFWFMRQAGRYLPEYQELRRAAPDFLRFCYTPELTVEAALQPLRRFHPDAAILFSDILVVPDKLGWPVTFVEGEGPVLAPLRRQADIDRLQLDGLTDGLAPVYESVTRLAAALPADTALIGFAGAPFTLAVYMIEGRGGTELETVRRLAYAEPALFARLMELLVEATVRHLGRQIEAGAEVVQLFDSWAGRLAEMPFRRLVIAPTRQIVARLKQAYPEIPVIGFPRGAGALYAAYATETGVDAVGFDAGVPLAWAKAALQPHVVVQGNLDNLLLAVGGAAMTAEVSRILDTLAAGPLIFNLGHGILPETPVAHLEQLAATLRTWRRPDAEG